jgi:hypothetical protein
MLDKMAEEAYGEKLYELGFTCCKYWQRVKRELNPSLFFLLDKYLLFLKIQYFCKNG